jgi:CRP/FNR family transcriptional regulator
MTTGVVKKYKKGEIIYSENSPTERLYFLKEGRVFLKCFDVDGNEFIYNLVPKNEYFGLSSIINAYAVSSAQAAADCEIYSIETKQLNELLIQYPEICLTAFKYVVRKFRNNEIRLKNISARNSKKLFSNHIISIMREKGKLLDNDTIVISSQLTNEEMASMLGISRETLSRLFNQAKREGIIDYNRKEIIIMNLEALINFSE